MTTSSASRAFTHALEQVKSAPVQTDPFAHLLVDHLFPDSFYERLLANFPERTRFEKVTYPGTGQDRRASHFHDYGLAFKDLSSHPMFSEVSSFLRSEEFMRLLLDRFSDPIEDGSTPIRASKHKFFKNGASDFSCVFDLHIDLPGYEIPPHPDIEQKIVTFQYFLVQGESLRDYGTRFCRPKNGRATTRRSIVARSTGRLVEQAAHIPYFGHRLHHRLARKPGFAAWCGLGPNRNWLPWSLFEIVKTAPALPNHFMAFAPNEHSYHGVCMDIAADNPLQERPVIRGFIRTGSDTENWINWKASQ